MFVYIESENWYDDEGIHHYLYTVGHYHPITGKFIPDSDYNSRDEAAQRVHYLNGGK